MGNGTPLDRPLEGEVKSIQFLRFVAAFIVVVYHAGIAGRDYGLFDSYYDRILKLTVSGEAGVHIFFVISGFIMVYATRGYEREWRSVGEFIYRRFARIYPIYWIYCGIYVFFHHFVWQQYDLDTLATLKVLLLWPGYSAGIIGPGWTLSYEVYFYLCFSACLLLPLIRSLIALTMFMVASIAIGILFELDGRALQVLTNALLLEFLMGAWIAVLVLLPIKIPRVAGDAALIVAAVGFVAPILPGFPAIPTVLLWGVPSALLVLGLALRERQGRAPAWMMSLSSLGNGSYSLYLLHNLVLDLTLLGFIALGATGSLGWLWASLTVLICCLAGNYAYVCLERPIHRALVGARMRRAPVPKQAGEAANMYRQNASQGRLSSP